MFHAAALGSAGRLWCGLASAAVLFSAGCAEEGPELAEVYGLVTMDGAPLSGATVEFTPVKPGAPSYGRTDEEGRYELRFSRDRTGAMIGTHIVRVRTAGYRETPEGEEERVPERVPAKYNLQSDEQREVKSGENEINLKLDSRGKVIDPEA